MESRLPGLVSLTVDVASCKACEVLIRAKAFLVFPVDIHRDRMKWLLITDHVRTVAGISKQLERYQCAMKIKRVVALKERGVLTEWQEQILRRAFLRGYFDYPRRTDTVGLAMELDISVSTFSEVMRPAQRRLVSEYLHS